jgi:hypothetical protein
VETKPVILRERRVCGSNLRIGLYIVLLESNVKGKQKLKTITKDPLRNFVRNKITTVYYRSIQY